MTYLMDLSSKEKYTLLIDILNVLRIRAYKFKICGKHLNPEFWFLLFKKHVSFYSVPGFLGCNMFFCPPNQTVQLQILKCVYFVLFLKASIKCFTSKYVIINQSFDQGHLPRIKLISEQQWNSY